MKQICHLQYKHTRNDYLGQSFFALFEISNLKIYSIRRFQKNLCTFSYVIKNVFTFSLRTLVWIILIRPCYYEC